MKADFSFRPVGQGGFYTGIFKSKSELAFVYDCGSKSGKKYLKYEIDDFKRKSNDNIDALVLSHLDEDHVNGISELLDGTSCDKVFLPYLTPIERLYVVLASVDKYSKNIDEYLIFMESPHRYLSEKNVRQIVYISGNDPEANNERPLENENEPRRGLDITSMTDARNWEIDGEIQSEGVIVKKGNTMAFFNLEWEFYFYNQKPETKPNETEKLAVLIEEIKTIYGFEVIKTLTPEQLRTLLHDKIKLRQMRKLWKKLYESTNSSGLVVMHRPLAVEEAFVAVPNLYFNHGNYFLDKDYYRKTRLKYKMVTLLTGDICASQIGESLYVSEMLPHICVLQIPHHGSRTGWDDMFLKSLNFDAMMVINFGYGNHYGHPSEPVMARLWHSNIVQATQLSGYDYSLVKIT